MAAGWRPQSLPRGRPTGLFTTWELTFSWEQVVEREREDGQAGKCGGLVPDLGVPMAFASAGTSLVHCGSGLPRGRLRTVSLLGH